MLKKRYKVFLTVFILIILCAAWLSSLYPYSYVTQPLSEKSFRVSEEDSCDMDQVPLWFTFQNGDALLHTSEGIGEKLDTISFLYPDGTTGTQKAEEFQYTDEMMGDLLIWAETDGIDTDGDGKQESLLASAKSQTLISQGYDAYGYYGHTFGDPAIPVEIVYGGSTFQTTAITVLVFGEPYTGTLRLQSSAGMDKTLDVTDGLVTECRISDLRGGLSVLINDEGNNRILAGSYIVEDYPLFSAGYLSSLSNLFLLIIIIIGGGAVISAVRRLVRLWAEKKRDAGLYFGKRQKLRKRAESKEQKKEGIGNDGRI